MKSRAVSLRTLIGYAGFALVFLIVAAAAVWRGQRRGNPWRGRER